MLTTFQKIKETIFVAILNVLLPSVDIFTDLGSVIKLYIGTRNRGAEGIYYISHPGWATALLVPFLINYLTTWIVWWSVDKRKTVSWIAPLFSVYPQVRAVNFGWYIYSSFPFLGTSPEGSVPYLDKRQKRHRKETSPAEGRI